MDINKLIEDNYTEFMSIRRYLHMYPELSEKEYCTKKTIVKFLNKWNIEFQEYNDMYGVVGLIKGKQKDNNHKLKTVALRADMDALPIQERNNITYKSNNEGVMHACGHDVHMTVLLGVAKILKELENNFSGYVKLIFQPSEETIGGAEKLIKLGCLNNPKVDYILGLHVDPEVPVGKIKLKYDDFYASTDEINIIVKGKTSHGALPHNGVDAMVIAANIILSSQTLVSREISPLENAVISFGKIDGGYKNNVITDTINIEGILRTTNNEVREIIIKRIKFLVEGIATSFGGNAEVIIKKGYISLINNNNVVDIIKKVANKYIGEQNIIVSRYPTMCGEDFAYYLKNVSGAFYHLGCRNNNLNINAPLHSDLFNVDEECIKIGILLQIKSALYLLNS